MGAIMHNALCKSNTNCIILHNEQTTKNPALGRAYLVRKWVGLELMLYPGLLHDLVGRMPG